MKNLKKALAIMVVFAMVLSTVAFAAPADVEGTDYEDAVVRLLALEIVSGFPDGDFQPEGKVTRAQMAKMIMTALGAGEAAKYGGATDFSDVAADHWGSGYIKLAAGRKVITGYGDGTFGPEDEVTYAQAITMIVRALGYEQKAKFYGGYPHGYIAVAAEEGITDDVAVHSDLPANRGNVALMLDQSLDVPMMVNTNWNPNDPDYDVDPDKTLLSDLDVDEFKGYVTAVPNLDDKLDDNEFKMLDEDSGKTKTFTAIGNVDFDTLLGVEVKVWADGDDALYVNVETDDNELLFDALKKIKKDGEEFKLDIADKTYDLADDVEIYVNFEKVDEDEIKDIRNNKGDNQQGVYGYFVLDSNEIVTANLFDFSGVYAGLVTEVEDKKIDIERGGNDIDLEDYDDGIYVYDKNFNNIDVDDIDVDSVIYAWEHEDDDIIYMVVVNETTTGELEEVEDGKVKVGGTKHDISKHLATYSTDGDDDIENFGKAEDLEDLLGYDVDVVLDIIGAASHVRGASAATSGVMFALYQRASTAGYSDEIRVFTQNGEEADYAFEKTADFNYLFDWDDDGDPADTDKIVKNGLIAFRLNRDAEIEDKEIYVYENGFKNRDGDSLYDLEDYELAVNNNATEFDDDDDSITYVQGVTSKTVYIEDNTVLFNIDDDKDAELVAWEEIEDITNAEVSALKGAVVIKDLHGLEAAVAVFVEIDKATSEFYYGVVTNKGKMVSGDNDWEIKVDALKEGEDNSEEKWYPLETKSDRNNIKKGDIIKFKLTSDDKLKIEAKNPASPATDKVVVDDDGDSISFDGRTSWHRFHDDAVIRELKANRDFKKTLDSDDIKSGSIVQYFINEKNKVAALVVLAEPDVTPPAQGDVTFEWNDATNTLTVSDAVYDKDDNTFIVKVTGDAVDNAIYSDAEKTLAKQGDKLIFTFGNPNEDETVETKVFEANGVYKFELLSVKDYEVKADPYNKFVKLD